MGPYETIGILGFICYVAAFAAVQFGTLDGNSATYSFANILAATLVGISLVAEFNLASALIQGSWIAIGIAGLALRAGAFARQKRGSAHQTLLETKLS